MNKFICLISIIFVISCNQDKTIKTEDDLAQLFNSNKSVDSAELIGRIDAAFSAKHTPQRLFIGEKGIPISADFDVEKYHNKIVLVEARITYYPSSYPGQLRGYWITKIDNIKIME